MLTTRPRRSVTYEVIQGFVKERSWSLRKWLLLSFLSLGLLPRNSKRSTQITCQLLVQRNNCSIISRSFLKHSRHLVGFQHAVCCSTLYIIIILNNLHRVSLLPSFAPTVLCPNQYQDNFGLYRAFIIGVPFSGECATVWCHQCNESWRGGGTKTQSPYEPICDYQATAYVTLCSHGSPPALLWRTGSTYWVSREGLKLKHENCIWENSEVFYVVKKYKRLSMFSLKINVKMISIFIVLTAKPCVCVSCTHSSCNH
jgi:hypothetical protein